MIDDIEQYEEEDSDIISQLIEKTELTENDHAAKIIQVLLEAIKWYRANITQQNGDKSSQMTSHHLYSLPMEPSHLFNFQEHYSYHHEYQDAQY